MKLWSVTATGIVSIPESDGDLESLSPTFPQSREWWKDVGNTQMWFELGDEAVIAFHFFWVFGSVLWETVHLKPVCLEHYLSAWESPFPRKESGFKLRALSLHQAADPRQLPPPRVEQCQFVSKTLTYTDIFQAGYLLLVSADPGSTLLNSACRGWSGHHQWAPMAPSSLPGLVTESPTGDWQERRKWSRGIFPGSLPSRSSQDSCISWRKATAPLNVAWL